jgi:hypothetical protein
MVTVTEKEAARLELFGAQRRLQRAEAALEFFFERHSDGDDRERHLLETECDEAARLVMKCRQELDSL